MKIAVLVSGSGTNLAALIAARDRGELDPAELAVVVSNRAGAGALERAKQASIPAFTIEHGQFPSRHAFEQALLSTLADNGVHPESGAVVLAGFMRVLTPLFVGAFPHRIINTHPALCPAFPGINAPKQAVEHGAKVSGCTVHFVDDGVDTGPIIFQSPVDILADDSPTTLHRRIQEIEHMLLPRAAALLAQGRLHVEHRRVRIGDK